MARLNDDLETLLWLEDNFSLCETSAWLQKMAGIELRVFFSGKYDSSSALLSIHSGQGGTEAMDWAEMLERMYLRYFEKKGWPHEVLEKNAGEEAGIKNVTLAVNEEFAYGYLKFEAGTHRLVRQSPFNADKLRQTSFALVEVLPQIDDSTDFEIKEDDLEWQFFRASSHGGQNVQKVSSAVRLIHRPSGIRSKTAKSPFSFCAPKFGKKKKKPVKSSLLR